ncbi:MAG: NUDIX hydrolase [bacterium]
MELRSTFEYDGQTYHGHYVEIDPDVDIGKTVKMSVRGVCFYGDKIVIVYDSKKKKWSLPGGGMESGETYRQAIVREIKEETNMRVVHEEWIGYQDVTCPDGKVLRQPRCFCIVEPFGDFAADPDGDITEIKLIEPLDYSAYFDWGEIGNRTIQKAMEMRAGHTKK